MEVETYEVTEATTEGKDSFEVEAEAASLIEELGLEGQKGLLAPDPDPDVKTGTRVPYKKMTQQEVKVYSTLYPQRVDVEKYNDGPIPVRVLQVVAHARGMFEKLQVWGPQVMDPDPVLVGVNGSYYSGDMFLLARWGDALAPFEELYQRAFESLKTEWVDKAQEVVSEARSFTEAPDALVRKHLNGGHVHKPWT